MTTPRNSLEIRAFLDEFDGNSGRYWPVDSPLYNLRRICYELLDERDKLRLELQRTQNKE